MSSNKIPAGKFKAQCLKLMDRVKKTRRKITITKRNVPVAQLTPIDEKEESAFGKLKGTLHILDNIVEPIEDNWHADS